MLAEFAPLLMFLVVCGVLMLGYPVAFSLAGTALLFAGIGITTGHFDPNLLKAMPDRLFGTINNYTLIAVPLFVLMGVMLEKSRIAEELLEAMGALTLDEVHVAYLDAVESAQGHRGVALATVINDAGSRAADEGGADEVFNTPRCAVRSSPGSPKGKKRKVRRPERRLGARRHAPSCVLTRHVAFA